MNFINAVFASIILISGLVWCNSEGSVSGTIFDTKQNPIDGALIEVFHYDTVANRRDEKAFAEFRTGGNGKFKIPIPGRSDKGTAAWLRRFCT